MEYFFHISRQSVCPHMWTILTAGIGWLFRCSVNGWSNVPFCWSPGKLFFGGGGGWFPPTLANGKGQHELTKVCRCTQHPVWHTEWSFEAFCTEDQSTTHNRVLARYLPAAIRGRPQNWIERDEKLNERDHEPKLLWINIFEGTQQWW